MATPRKHWFKVADSVADEDWSNDVLATLIRLQARMNTRWARNGLSPEDAATITLTAGDVMTVTRRSRFARGAALVRECTHAVTMTVHVGATSVTVHWPKWPEFQGLPDRRMPESSPRVALSETQTQTPPQDARQKRAEAPPAPPAKRAPRARRSPPAPFPGSMTQDDWTGLGTKHGVDPVQLEEFARGWATEKLRDYTADGWKQAIDRSLRDRWSWTQSLFATPGHSVHGERESPAQAKVRRTKEAARRVMGRIDGPGEAFALIPSEVQR